MPLSAHGGAIVTPVEQMPRMIVEDKETAAYQQAFKLPEFTFAGINPLVPRVFEIRVAVITALIEPSTPASATANLVRVLIGGALGTLGDDWCS